jgi:hypothetical protein
MPKPTETTPDEIVLRAKVWEGITFLLSHDLIRRSDFDKALKLMDRAIFPVSNAEVHHD